jgi:hypothetical protein
VDVKIKFFFFIKVGAGARGIKQQKRKNTQPGRVFNISQTILYHFKNSAPVK